MEKRYIGFKPEAFQNVRTAVIDGDGFAWAIGWIFKEALTNKEVTDAVDNCVHDILMGVQAEHYIGVLGPSNEIKIVEMPDGLRPAVAPKPNFRKAIAKSRPYKGNRPDRPEWYIKWSPIIEQHLEEAWGFVRTPEGFEADDLVATFMSELTSAGAKPICCGNDKDLLQIPGEHFNVVKKGMQTLDLEQCQNKLWTQCLMGDSTDGIEGIPGMGPKGAEKVLVQFTPSMNHGSTNYEQVVIKTYTDKFGQDLGIQKFYENYMLVKLRTDVPTDCFEIDQICCGYDLAYWNEQRSSSSEFEPVEEIPPFDFVDLTLIEFEQNHTEDHLEDRRKNE